MLYKLKVRKGADMATGFLHTGFRTRIVAASGTILKDAIVAQGGITGVAQTALASGASGWMGTSGVWNLPVPAGTVRGDALYVPGQPPTDSTGATLTKTATGNTLFGVAETDRDSKNNSQVKLAQDTQQRTSFTAGQNSAQIAQLGAPALAVADYVVASTNMKVGAYTLAHATLDVARNVVVTSTAAGAADTQGTVTVVGTNILGAPITEVITPSTAAPVAGLKAFKTITSVTGAGWVINAGNDTIVVGTGNAIGLPYAIADADHVFLATLDGTVTTPNAVAGGTVETSTVDLSAGTYNGSKKVSVVYAL